MISLCESMLAPPINNQPPNLTAAPVANQQAAPVPTQNQNTPVQNTNPAAEQQPVANQQNSFDWKKVLKPLAIGGAAIGTLGLAHAMYNGNSLNPLNYLPKFGSGAAMIGGGDESNSNDEPTNPGGNENNNSGENTRKSPRVTNEIYANKNAPMQGPPPQEHIPQRTRTYMYREAYPMHPPRTGGLSYLFGSPHLPPRRYYR